MGLTEHVSAGDYRTGKLPGNVADITKHYRDYLDDNGDVIEDRRPYYELFLYVVGRFFPSMNPTVNVYNGIIRKTVDLSEVFSASDEAWVLLIMKNYTQGWLRMLENPECKHATVNTVVEGKVTVWRRGSHRVDPFFKAEYTSSQNGKKSSGWTNEGVKKFNEYLAIVKECRGEYSTGGALETCLREHWIGQTPDAGVEEMEAERNGVVEEDYTDLELFGV